MTADKTYDPKILEKVLSLPLGALPGVTNVRGYLAALLRELWAEGPNFSGKRPFGNSGWHYDLYVPLIKSGLIAGSLDEDGYIDECDDRAGKRLIAAAIEHRVDQFENAWFATGFALDAANRRAIAVPFARQRRDRPAHRAASVAGAGV